MANEQAWILASDLNKTRIWRTSKRAPRRQRGPSFSPEMKEWNFGLLFILDVATYSQRDHKLFNVIKQTKN